MNLEIGDNIRISITPESKCWVVSQLKTFEKGKNAGKTYWETTGYFVGLDNALRDILRTRAGKSNKTHHNLESALAELKDLWNEILRDVPEELHERAS